MKKKLLTILLLITSPIWFLPVVICSIIKEVWLGLSEYVDRKVK